MKEEIDLPQRLYSLGPKARISVVGLMVDGDPSESVNWPEFNGRYYYPLLGGGHNEYYQYESKNGLDKVNVGFMNDGSVEVVKVRLTDDISGYGSLSGPVSKELGVGISGGSANLTRYSLDSQTGDGIFKSVELTGPGASVDLSNPAIGVSLVDMTFGVGHLNQPEISCYDIKQLELGGGVGVGFGMEFGKKLDLGPIQFSLGGDVKNLSDFEFLLSEVEQKELVVKANENLITSWENGYKWLPGPTTKSIRSEQILKQKAFMLEKQNELEAARQNGEQIPKNTLQSAEKLQRVSLKEITTSIHNMRNSINRCK